MIDMADRAFERIVGGGFFPTFDGDVDAYLQAVERHGKGLVERGITHVPVNQGAFSIPLVQDPQNSYLRFSTFAYPLDKFVDSDVNKGIYDESALEANRKLLLKNLKHARSFGLRGYIMCCEPAFMPESFYDRWPALRGPRSDNPACSRRPLFAPCVVVPEVEKHYRQMIKKLLTLAPEIDEMHIFANDSGSGVCYSEGLYAGPNGAYHCRNVSPGKHMQRFMRYLLEAGREVNPHFRVIFLCAMAPHEVRDVQQGAVEGMATNACGAFAWFGGLEDRWGTQAEGSASEDMREELRAWQYRDFSTRVELARKANMNTYAAFAVDYYMPPIPRPFETHQVLRELRDMGVQNLMGGPSGGKWDVNTEVFVRFLADPDLPAEQLVGQIAREWVGEEHAGELVKAWRIIDTMDRARPIPPGGHALPLDPDLRNAPIVPDFSRLQPGDLEHYGTSWSDDLGTMRSQQGGAWRRVYLDPQEARWLVDKLEERTFPQLEEAEDTLSQILASHELTESARECVERELRVIRSFHCTWRSMYHWFLAGSIVIEDLPAIRPALSMKDIIEMEIANQRDVQTASGGSSDSPRIALMEKHKDDPVREVDLSDFELARPRGRDGFPNFA